MAPNGSTFDRVSTFVHRLAKALRYSEGMNRIFRSSTRFLAALLLLFTGPAIAQQSQSAPPLVSIPVTGQVLRPALWQVSDGDTTIFLFGTIHALPQGMVWLTGPVAATLDASDELVTEIPELQPDQVQAAVLDRALLPAGQTLRGLLSPTESTAYDAAMSANGLPPIAFDRRKPWYAALALTTLPLMREGYAVENGVEGALTARMKELKRPHTGLETMEFQLGIFDNLPQATQLQYLNEVVKGQGEIKAQLDAMVAEWGQGNAEQLALLMTEDEGDDPAMREALFTSRNRSWTGWIEQRLARPGTVFIAVGAGHLAGTDSVLDMLGKRGLKVERLQ